MNAPFFPTPALHKEGGHRLCHWLHLQRAVPALKAASDPHQCELSVGVWVTWKEGWQVKQWCGAGIFIQKLLATAAVDVGKVPQLGKLAP